MMNCTCSICSELFMPSDDIHITPCGHTFHYACLLQWLERSKTCPQCRNKCIAKSLIKVYFTIATNVDGPEDNATLLEKLDNLTLSVREKDKKLKDFEETISSHKTDRKKMKKMVATLEEMVDSKNFTIGAYKQEVDMLRGDRTHLLKVEEELKQLKTKLQLMTTVEYVLNSTVKEVEEVLASNGNPQLLAVSVVQLKRELKACEIKRNEMRERIKLIHNDLYAERAKRKDLEDKLSTADSEIYRLEQKVTLLQKNAAVNVSTESGSDTSIPNTPDQPLKRKRIDTDLDKSTPMSDKVRNILQSDSPYQSIKSSSIGLLPIFRPGLSASATLGKGSSSGTKLTKTHSDLSEKYSIFQKSRPADRTTLPSNSNLVFNGLGGSQKQENFPGFPVPKEPTTTIMGNNKITKLSSSTSARLKAGKLSKHPSTLKNKASKEMDDYFDITLL